MMPSYSQNKWYAIYFVSYLCTMLYVMMNLVLAVVNETFTSRERDKFKKLFLHKRKACQHAFRLLVSKQDPDKMRFRQFDGLMRYYAPNKCIIFPSTAPCFTISGMIYNIQDISWAVGTFTNYRPLSHHLLSWFLYFHRHESADNNIAIDSTGGLSKRKTIFAA